MKIRTITLGFSNNYNSEEKNFKEAGLLLNKLKKILEKNNYYVQTIRASTQSWDDYFDSKNQIVELSKNFEEYSKKYDIDYFNIGPTFHNNHITNIYDIIDNTSIGFCTAYLSDSNEINYEGINKTSKLIKKLSKINNDGFANLRFAALFNVKPGCPFYPASYHKGNYKSLSIGFENSDLLYKAFSDLNNIENAGQKLHNILYYEYKKIEDICIDFCNNEKIVYGGIDPSISPSVNPKESIAYAFEKLGIKKFGDPGTLTISKIITDTLKNLEITKCGYCGLMLPVLEDFGLSERNNEGTYNINNLLVYSAVCGIGLDTIPIPGNISLNKINNLLADISSLSNKLNKQLSARLMPIPNKCNRDLTEYNFNYFVNSKIMKI